jgi:hypothetical protein
VLAKTVSTNSTNGSCNACFSQWGFFMFLGTVQIVNLVNTYPHPSIEAPETRITPGMKHQTIVASHILFLDDFPST